MRQWSFYLRLSLGRSFVILRTGACCLGYVGYNKLGVGLTMAHLSLLVLLGLVGHNGDLLSLAVLYDLSGNRYIRKIRCADFKLFAVAVSEDFVNCDGLVGFSSKLFNEDLVILGDLVLFAAGLDNCVHSFIHPFL